MIKTLKIMLWDEEIGRLMWDDRRRTTYFMYNPSFVKRGLDVSPLVAPVGKIGAVIPVWGEDAKIYQKLPAFVADSLPDAWGNQLFELWRQQNHISNADINPLDKLSFIGKRGMGALEFVPEVDRERKSDKINMHSLLELAERIFTERDEVTISDDDSLTLQSLMLVGTSAGGRQPKAIIAINRATGEIRSGQIAGLEGFDYYLMKFGNAQHCSAELEMTYYQLATAAGIRMMPSELYEVEGDRHFLTRRFDREGCNKLFTQTLAAVNPDADSYEQLMSTCRKLHLPEADCQEVFRRMVFNILANNTDDHIKNFSFIMNKDGSWQFSPAYDLTYIVDLGGFRADEDHCMYVRAKLRGITREDAIAFARDNGIRRPDAIIHEVAQSLTNFRKLATENGVSQKWIGRVEDTINTHLKIWGELEDGVSPTAVIINSRMVSNVRLELSYKGNYHLYATIDGCERKFVIGSNKPEYSMMEQTGITNISHAQMLAMVEKYMLD